MLHISLESEEGFSSIFKHATTGMSIISPDGIILSANPFYCDFLGYSEEELIGKSVLEITHHADRATTNMYFEQAVKEKSNVFTYEKQFLRKDGSAVWGLATVAWVQDQQGNPRYGIAMIQDIHALKESLNELQHREKLYRTLVDNIGLGISIVDKNNQVLMVNKTFAKWFKKSVKEFPGKFCYCEFEGRQKLCTDCPGLKSLRTGKPEMIIRDVIKENRRTVLRIKAFPLFDREGIADRFIEVVEDISEQKADKERLDHLAYYDQLTNLPNRTLLMNRLVLALARARRNKRMVAVFFLDLDHFKRANDSYGHHIGDKVLVNVAEKLCRATREIDTIARFGGDEFILLVEDFKDLNALKVIAKRVLSVIKDPITIHTRKFHLSGSIGISVFPQDGKSPEKLMRRADTAMYRAKECGRNSFQFFSERTERQVQRLLKLEDCLRSAVEENQFILHYQPQVNLVTRETIGFEALIRWQHPGNGMISPGEFIPLAEETGMIIPMGRWALETACRQAKRWETEGMPAKVAVNISALQFRAGNFPELIKKILRQADLPPELLEIELTESMIMQNVDKAIEIMHELSEHGVSIAIDDFGTGYSSLSYLKRFPIKCLKIDQSFVSDVENDPNSAAIADAVINLAHSLGLEVIAEGVETEGQRDFLLEKGCTKAQGFLFDHPRPAEEFSNIFNYEKKMSKLM